MSLLTYKDARPWSRSVRAHVANRTMPPWFADEGHRPLVDDRRLNDNELMTILAWVDGGALEGNPADLPPPPAHATEDWRIGRPDAVFQLPREFTVPATGLVDIQYFEVATQFTEDKWVQHRSARPPAKSRDPLVAAKQFRSIAQPRLQWIGCLCRPPLGLAAAGSPLTSKI